jgi:hypothetical protein
MNQEDIYLKLTQANITGTIPIIIPLKGLITYQTSGSLLFLWYKGTSSKLGIAVQTTAEVEKLKSDLNKAIVAAIKGGEEQQYYPFEIYSKSNVTGGWV